MCVQLQEAIGGSASGRRDCISCDYRDNLDFKLESRDTSVLDQMEPNNFWWGIAGLYLLLLCNGSVESTSSTRDHLRA